MADVDQSHGLLGEKFTCLICGQEGLSDEKMRNHVLVEHVENTVCCPFCDLAGITSDEMTLHINSVHFDDLAKQQTSGPGKQNGDLSCTAENGEDMNENKKLDPDTYGKAHGGAIPKTTGKSLKHSHSLDQSPHRSPSRKSGGIKTSQSESNINRRGRLSLNFDIINEPGPSHSASSEAIKASASAQSIRSSVSAQSMRMSTSYNDSFNGAFGSSVDLEPNNTQTVRLRLQSSIHNNNDVILEESQDNNNIPLQPNLNQVLQPDINDNVEPDINSNMPAAFSCPLCQFITSSENLIQAHVNMAHVDVLSPARPRSEAVGASASSAANSTRRGNTDISSTTQCSGVVKDEYPCPICLKIYDNVGELSLHVNQAHSQIFSPDRPVGASSGEAVAGPSSFQCPVCGLELYERSRLEAHVNGHFSAEQTPIIERNDRLIAQALQDKEADIAGQEEQKEFQKLQAMYGMVDGNTPYKRKYEKNLERAVANGDMTITEFHERKIGFKYADSRGIDDGNSCTKGVIQRLQEYYRTPTHGVSKAYLCTSVDHYAGSFGDKGYGCGYRNFQMLLSSLITDSTYCRVLFNDRPLMPSITKIQQLIEAAWEKGYDKQGREQLAGRVLNTEKWIGATEIVATLSSLKVRCRLLDFHNPSGTGGTHPKLFEWVKTYFEKGGFKPPLYLQHQGHSRTIVGIEELKDKRLRLLIFDPSMRKKQMMLFHSIVNANLMRTLRRPLENMKAKQYQIVAVVGTLSEQECQESKVLKSERLS
ncbi:zinc finger-containing ubiquitin peptidase 1-like [Mya arenaria]|uniref:zinc finger-containing ubiquitin peptidase 1-like n=1 Tax=Mya arenaria TaxID=6604 RepID=UPI0022E03025|nr:zinc finger-containing ubiquitin peptidase 1-like [Mya arenaria]